MLSMSIQTLLESTLAKFKVRDLVSRLGRG